MIYWHLFFSSQKIKDRKAKKEARARDILLTESKCIMKEMLLTFKLEKFLKPQKTRLLYNSIMNIHKDKPARSTKNANAPCYRNQHRMLSIFKRLMERKFLEYNLKFLKFNYMEYHILIPWVKEVTLNLVPGDESPFKSPYKKIAHISLKLEAFMKIYAVWYCLLCWREIVCFYSQA